ncbi:ATP-binding cassette, sub-B (MDR TAP), member 4, partial [Nowakowskiella sp. JEL0078]
MFIYFGIAIFAAGYFSQLFWVLTGENQTRKIRQKYVHAILRQDQSWFDKAEDGSLATRLAQDTQLIQDGISEKAGLSVQSVTGFIVALIVAFVKGWKLALVLLAALPVLGVIGVVMIFIINKYIKEGQDSYADAGAIVEQAISGIRTVYAFSLQTRFQEKYQTELEKAYNSDLKKGKALATGFGLFMVTLFSTYGLAFYYGSRLVLWGDSTPGEVLVVFMCILMGAYSLISIPHNISAMSTALGAADKIYSTIDRIPEIDIESSKGLKPRNIKGSIKFKNVKFAYPTRLDVPVLKNLSFEAKPGMTVAFVGPSGSGKSTGIALLQRFYDVLSGSVSVDGINIKKYNVKYLRDKIGVVSQEPILFNSTIKQNILMGGTYPITESELISVCKIADCHNFIMNLPDGYDTVAGESGSQLSGGQKQRIAIARALVRNPKILLLDEATSALDTQNERIVQHLIIVMEEGVIVEKGTHDELLSIGGTYSQLVEKQKIKFEVDSIIGSGLEKTHGKFDEDEYDNNSKKKISKSSVNESARITKQIKFQPTNPNNTEIGKCNEIYLKLDDKETYKETEKLKKRLDAVLLKNKKREKAPLARILKLMKP